MNPRLRRQRAVPRRRCQHGRLLRTYRQRRVLHTAQHAAWRRTELMKQYAIGDGIAYVSWGADR